MTYGATPDDWDYWDLAEGATADLLPVVCRPDAAIHPKSVLKQYGKVPSRFTVDRKVVGFPNWTTYHASDRDVAQWRADPDLGICLQTRSLRALDFDLTDATFAEYVRDALALLGYQFPYRTRSNSSKFLTLFRLDGDYGKQTLKTPHGVIEFLATGQQCVVAGTHPTGTRYQWDWNSAIPIFGAWAFDQLLLDLECIVNSDAHSGDLARVRWSAPSRARVVSRHASAAVADPVVDYLRAQGLVLREAPDGRIFLSCPWRDTHTTHSDLTETCWFPAGTNGFEQGHFRCLHAHCQDKEDWQFLRAIGFDEAGFEDIGPPIIRRSGVSWAGVSTDDLRAWARDGLDPSTAGDHCPPQQDGRRRPSTALEASHEERILDHASSSHLLHRSENAVHQQRTPMPDQGATLPEGNLSATLTAFDAHLAPDRPVVVAGGAGHPLDQPPFERSKDGKIKPLLHNLVQALERPDLCGAVIGRDEFKDEIVWRPWVRHQPWLPGPDTFQHPQIQPFKDSDYVKINMGMRQLGFGPGDIPLQAFRLALNSVADTRSFDSAITWINTLPPWDGVSRIDTFCSSYLGSEDTPYTRAVGRYWWTAHAGRVVVPGIQADMAVVLVSTQGTYKTSCLRELVPHEDHYVELDLVARDEDLCRKMRGKLIGEMAELRGINSKDIEAIKAWVSRRREEWVPKYLEFSRSFPRRLVLVGTSNQDEFLADETGNRRWLPMVVGDRQALDALRRDRIQLWAEAYELYLGNGIFWSEAEQLARHQHGAFMIQHEWEFSIHEWLYATDEFSGGRPIDREYLRLHDITRGALGIQTDKLNMTVQFQVSKILRKMGFVKFSKRVDGKICKVWQKGSFMWEDYSRGEGVLPLDTPFS